jgi:UDP-sugar pyrophosphorylase
VKACQMHCMLQVPCLSDGDAHVALDPKDPFRLQTKPHGHGDVHALLVSNATKLRLSSLRQL